MYETLHIHNGNILSIVSQNIHRSGNEDCALSSSCMNLVRILACITLLVSVEGGDEWAAVWAVSNDGLHLNLCTSNIGTLCLVTLHSSGLPATVLLARVWKLDCVHLFPIFTQIKTIVAKSPTSFTAEALLQPSKQRAVYFYIPRGWCPTRPLLLSNTFPNREDTNKDQKYKSKHVLLSACIRFRCQI